MGTFENALLGITFWLIAFTNTVLMFKLWGYPYDHERLKTSAPRSLLLVHRSTGYIFLILYVYFLIIMVPRMWEYQLELPARSVAHLVMGICIGILLLVKILIVRFFKHLESTTVPILGIGVLVCTTVLIGLSAPMALRETYLSRAVLGAGHGEQMERVQAMLPRAGYPEHAPVDQLATPSALRMGREILLQKCTQCHDLRTVLAKPRTPSQWLSTVQRMADRAVLEPISEEEQWHVAAYLIGITPDIQRSVELKRREERGRASMELMIRPAVEPITGLEPGTALSLAAAQETFEDVCSGCHLPAKVEKAPPTSEQEARALVARMVENGLDAEVQDLEQVVFFLISTYGR